MADKTDRTEQGRFVSRGAALAGAALALPLASNATPITSGIQNVFRSTNTSTDATYDLDLNGDAVMDFTFRASFTNLSVTVLPLVAGNGYIGTTAPNNATPLSYGSPIDGSATYQTVQGNIQKSKDLKFFKQKGPWPNPNGGFAYLGVRFDISGQTHYGWVELSATTPDDSGSNDSRFTIRQWGYESDANVGSFAGAGSVPEPSSLTLVALGAAGLAALRARRKRSS